MSAPERTQIADKLQFSRNCNSEPKKISIVSINEISAPVKFDTNEIHLPFKVLEIKAKIIKAIAEHKICMISGSRSIRSALKARGWIEKRLTTAKRDLEFLEGRQIQAKINDIFNNYQYKLGDLDNLDELQSKFCEIALTNVIPNFCWNCLPYTKTNDIPKNTIVNRIGSKFTNKEILSKNLTELSRGSSCMIDIQYPRCYSLNDTEHYADFVENFQLTACMSCLKYFLHHFDLDNLNSICSDNGTLELNVIEFAINRLMEYIQFKKHEDLDNEINYVDADKWNMFLENAYQFVHKDQKLKIKFKIDVINLIDISRQMLESIRAYWPQYRLDGMLNIWIVKPGHGSRGRNVHVTSSLQEINNFHTRTGKVYRWVVQKYIEKPLLIHNTKFDIRVWFVLKPTPLEIWMYKDCYLRFCSRPFDLANVHEAVHLANYCIQRKYRNQFTHSDLPQNNMWHSNTFQSYLNSSGYVNKWHQTILPGIAHCIVGAILSVESNIKPRPNSFQLYGADFILDEKCSPWLLEINSSPDTSHTTSVTASLVPKCMEDIIKVIVDSQLNPKASTGRFTCIFSETVIHNTLAPSTPLNLTITGTKIVRKLDEKANDIWTNSGVYIKNFRYLKHPNLNIDNSTVFNLQRIKNTTQFPKRKSRKKLSNKVSAETVIKTVSSYQICMLKNHILAQRYLNLLESGDGQNKDNNNLISHLHESNRLANQKILNYNELKQMVTLYTNTHLATSENIPKEGKANTSNEENESEEKNRIRPKDKYKKNINNSKKIVDEPSSTNDLEIDKDPMNVKCNTNVRKVHRSAKTPVSPRFIEQNNNEMDRINLTQIHFPNRCDFGLKQKTMTSISSLTTNQSIDYYRHFSKNKTELKHANDSILKLSCNPVIIERKPLLTPFQNVHYANKSLKLTNRQLTIENVSFLSNQLHTNKAINYRISDRGKNTNNIKNDQHGSLLNAPPFNQIAPI